MREYEQEVREQYEIEIKSTRRTRGAFFCIGNADTEVRFHKSSENISINSVDATQASQTSILDERNPCF